jgi:non-specific serine/threonine protein kinase/serine/threonine-protein kinase
VSGSPARVQQLFEQAIDLAPPARADWLARLHESDPAAARQVAQLLALDAAEADPFGSAIASLRRTLESDAAALVGSDVGGFRLLRVLGQGGMGTVFLARRRMRDFQQLVALKVLRGQWLDPAALERFAAERRILARLHQPNIATLIDAGATGEGLPFLVMEYIDGVPLLDYCDAHRLDIPARLRLARGLLAALAYAHRALVVHRDLKPGNVLVTPDGTPKLLDFGIARLVEADAPGNATATRACTPDYASPEQLAGEPVGTGSDIYSFGLVLYECCVGVLPWDSGARPPSGPATSASTRFRQQGSTRRAELAARRHSHPQRLARGLRGDLGHVLARCLEPDPAARYASADALDQDLAALLDRRPPPGVQVPPHQRAMAFARRHAWPLGLAALVAVATAALLVQALRGERRLEAERDRALASARSARVEAAKSAQVASFVRSMLGGIDPDRAHGMDRRLMRLVLDSAATRAERELDGQPAVRAAIERTMAESYNGIGEYEQAIVHFDASLAALARGGGTPAEQVSLAVRKARSQANLGRSLLASETVQDALRAAPMLPADSRERLFAESNLAGFACDVGKYQACHDGYARVLAVQRRVLGEADRDSSESLYGLAWATSSLGHFDESVALYRELLERYRRQYGESDSHTFSAINGLAVAYSSAGRFAEAEALLAEALPRVRKAFGEQHPTTLGMVSNLGGAIRQQGRNEEARPYYEASLASARSLFGEDSQRYVVAAANLAQLLRDAGELPAAARMIRDALLHGKGVFGEDSPRFGMLLGTQASILLRLRRFGDADHALTRAAALLAPDKGFGPDHPAVQALVNYRIALYEAWGKPALAAEWRVRKSEP